jgi:hypothetical protein
VGWNGECDFLGNLGKQRDKFEQGYIEWWDTFTKTTLEQEKAQKKENNCQHVNKIFPLFYHPSSVHVFLTALFVHVIFTDALYTRDVIRYPETGVGVKICGKNRCRCQHLQ